MTGITEPLTYTQALEALAERGRFGINLGLGRVRAVLRELGDPQLGLRGALVAGTNGKGSVLALAGSALRAAGLRVGETPKPHLVSYRERLVVDGRPVPADTFARLVGEVLVAADRIPRRLGDPTEFELLTAVIFRWFAEQALDVALVEVGLGGRLDATHAWDGGVAVVTNVDLDHQDRLGDTVTAIAREKAAIIERGDLAVTGATGDALAVIRRRASRLGVPLTVVAPAPLLGLGSRRPDRRAAGARTDPGRPARPPPGGQRRRRRRAARRPRRGRDRGGGRRCAAARLCRRRAGRAASSCSRSAAARSCSTAPTTRPARRPSPTALDDLRPFLAPGPITLLTASMADKDVDGVVARPGRARRPWPAPPSSASRSMSRAPCRPTTWPRIWRSGRPRATGAGRDGRVRARTGFARALGRRRRPGRRGRLAVPRRCGPRRHRAR